MKERKSIKVKPCKIVQQNENSKKKKKTQIHMRSMHYSFNNFKFTQIQKTFSSLQNHFFSIPVSRTLFAMNINTNSDNNVQADTQHL